MKVELKSLFPFHLGSRLTLGIDITEEAVRGILLARKGEEVSVLRWEEVPISEDPEIPPLDSWNFALQKLLRQFSVSRVHVTVSLPSSSFFLSTYFIHRTASKDIGEMILEKLEEHKLPFKLEDSTVSYASQQGAPRDTYLVACAEKRKVSSILSTLRSAGVASCFLLPSDVSLLNCLHWRTPGESLQTAAALRFGKKESVLSFFDEEGFRLRRIINIGREDLYGKLLSADLFPEKKPAREELFHLLGEYFLDKACSQEMEQDLSPPPRRIYELVLPVLEHITFDVQKTFHFYRNNVGKSPVSVLYLLDDFRGLKKIEAFLEERLQVPVEFLNTLSHFSLAGKATGEPPRAEAAACFAPSAGLALEEEGKLSLIHREDMFLPRLQVLRTITRFTAGILCLVMILLSLFYWRAVTKLKETKRISETIDGKLESILWMKREFNRLKDQDLRYEKVLAELIPQENRIIGIMKELSRLVSPFVSLERLEVTASKEESFLRMSGIFAVGDEEKCDEVQSEFINSLEASPLLENLSMKGEEWIRRKGFLESVFTLTADLYGSKREDP